MSFVHSLNATPPPRFDALPWTRVRIEGKALEAPDYAAIETLVLSVVDTDPAHPVARRLTTALAPDAVMQLRVVWIDAADNETAPSEPVTSPSTADDGYPSLEALLAASTNPSLLAASSADQLALRASAIRAVEFYAGQSFTVEGSAEEPVTKTLDGNGRGTLWLPSRLISLSALSVAGGALTTDDVGISDDGSRLAILAGRSIGSTWADRAIFDMEWDGRSPVFGLGPAAVTISGVWGWSQDDWDAGRLDAVERAIRFDMEDNAGADANKLAATVRAARALGIKSISQGDISLGLGATAEPSLSPRVRRELADLRWAGDSVAVV